MVIPMLAAKIYLPWPQTALLEDTNTRLQSREAYQIIEVITSQTE